MDARALARAVREHRGFVRKSPLGEACTILGVPSSSWGEDAAVIDRGGDELLLLAADGIIADLVETDPRFEGRCAVLVNVNDIVAMGGTPIAIVNVVSAHDDDLPSVLAGLHEGADLLGVPVVGGHIHPDAPRTGVSATALGTVPRDSLLTSSGGSPGDAIVVAVDLAGEAHPRWPLAWRPPDNERAERYREAHDAVRAVAERHLATAGKDASNPGIIGTIGMLLETSSVGGVVHADRIPRPDGVPVDHWSLVYPARGFVFTTDRPDELIRALDGSFTSAVVGEADGSGVLSVGLGGQEAPVVDLKRGGVAGMWPRPVRSKDS